MSEAFDYVEPAAAASPDADARRRARHRGDARSRREDEVETIGTADDENDAVVDFARARAPSASPAMPTRSRAPPRSMSRCAAFDHVEPATDGKGARARDIGSDLRRHGRRFRQAKWRRAARARSASAPTSSRSIRCARAR